MSRKSIMQIASDNYDEIIQYCLANKEDELNDQQKLIVNRWRTAYDILRNTPVKYNAIKKLRLLYPISENQAAADVECAMKMWSFNNKYHKDFLEAFFINGLLEGISKFKDEMAIAKMFANLQKHLRDMPANELDPKHMEKNNVYIQFNINNSQFVNIPQGELNKLPQDQLQRLFEGIPHEIKEAEAIEIMES